MQESELSRIVQANIIRRASKELGRPLTNEETEVVQTVIARRIQDGFEITIGKPCSDESLAFIKEIALEPTPYIKFLVESGNGGLRN